MSDYKFDVLILGGGQLAQMMFEEGKKLSLRCGVVCSHEREPAAKIFGKNNTLLGDIQEVEFVKSLNKASHRFTFENEFLNTALFSKYIENAESRFFPNLKTLEKIQDKLEQKKICNNLKLPSTNWISYNEDSNDLRSWLIKLQQIFGGSFVIKWARGGYDGKGVFVWKSDISQNLDKRMEEAITFCELGLSKTSRLFAESFIHFKTELACVGARNSLGQITLMPVVKSIQENSICKYVLGPARLFDVPESVETKIFQMLSTALDGLNYVGCLAMEFFLDHEYQVWVNEFAPRVHNTGHYSLDASSFSQFALHLKAINNLDLAKNPQHQNYFGMINLIGKKLVTPALPPEENKEAGIRLHWYAKDESKPGRKMGHINIWAENESQFFKRLNLAKQIDLDWSFKN